MLSIKEFDDTKNYTELKHSINVFHEALVYVKKGQTNFCVINEDGDGYNLEWLCNNDLTKNSKEFPKSSLFADKIIHYEFLNYDELDDKNLYLGVFESFENIFFECINEYAVAITRALLSFTDKNIYTSNEMLLSFFEPSERIRLVSSVEEIEGGNTMTVIREFVHECTMCVYSIMPIVTLFHCMFFMQHLNEISNSDSINLIFSAPDTEGIGSILNFYVRIKSGLEKYGINVSIKSARYKAEILGKYFDVNTVPDDKTKDNLSDGEIWFEDLFAVYINPMFSAQSGALTKNILKKDFLNQIEEYREVVFGDKKILGVLVRGTDYIVSNMAEQPLPVSDLAEKIRTVKESGNYDKIFLATEDQYYFDELLKLFHNDIIVVSQIRSSTNDFKNINFISELEAKRAKDDGLEEIAEDNLVNYFYAIYLLSTCSGFIGTPRCNGVFMVESLNEGKFEYFRVHSRHR